MSVEIFDCGMRLSNWVEIGLCRLADNLPREDVAHGIHDDGSLLVSVVAFELREILKTQQYGDLVRAGCGDQVVQPFEVDGRQLVDDNTRFELSLLVDELDDARIVQPESCAVDILSVGVVAHDENLRGSSGLLMSSENSSPDMTQ